MNVCTVSWTDLLSYPVTGTTLRADPPSDSVVRSDQLQRELGGADQLSRVSYMSSCPVVRLSLVVDRGP